MVDRSPRRSRRLRGLSPPSLEPSPRRRRGNTVGGFHPMAADALGIDPPDRDISVQNRPCTSAEQERKTPALSQVLFQSKDNIEVEEFQESLAAPNSTLPFSYPEVLQYIGSQRPSSPGHITHLPSMTTTGSMASTTSATTMQTPTFVQGGGTISIPSTYLFGSFSSTSLVGSTSIPSTSGNSQANASSSGFFPFGTHSHGIPSVPFSASTSMMGGSTSLQGFPFGSGHIPHSNLTVGSMPFSSTGQSSNPFQGWTNPTVSGTGNPFFGQ